MIIKRTVAIDAANPEVKYEAVIQGELEDEFNGVVVVHDPEAQGGRRRGFLVPQGVDVPNDHVIVCRIAVK